MKHYLTLLALLAASAGSWAQTVYTYTSPNYVGPSGEFTTAMHLAGTVTSATPFPPNLTNEPVGPGTSYPITWSFNDGVRTFTESNSARVFASTSDMTVTTNAAGTLTAAEFYLMSPGPVHTVGQTIHLMLAGQATTFVNSNMTCSTVSPEGQCTGTDTSPTRGYGSPGGSVVGTWTQVTTTPPAAAVPTPVPTLGWPALAVLTALVAGAVGYRRRTSPQRHA